jgi:hypothetical protein
MEHKPMNALTPLALSLVPDLARWLSTGTAEQTESAISTTIQTITGSADPVAAATAVQNSQMIAGELRVALAKISADQEVSARASDLQALKAAIGDSAVGRVPALATSSQKSALAWSAPVVSGIVLLTFAAIMTFVLTHSLPAGSETMANMLLGTLSAMATSVVSYWVGSSAGSARKDEQIAQSARVSSAS